MCDVFLKLNCRNKFQSISQYFLPACLSLILYINYDTDLITEMIPNIVSRGECKYKGQMSWSRALILSISFPFPLLIRPRPPFQPSFSSKQQIWSQFVVVSAFFGGKILSIYVKILHFIVVVIWCWGSGWWWCWGCWGRWWIAQMSQHSSTAILISIINIADMFAKILMTFTTMITRWASRATS